MLTNEKVLELFREYMTEDQALDVVETKRGYAVMLWDYAGQDWSDVACCATPEELFEKLLDSFTSYHEYLLLRDKETLSEAELWQVEALRQPFLEKRREWET